MIQVVDPAVTLTAPHFEMRNLLLELLGETHLNVRHDHWNVTELYYLKVIAVASVPGHVLLFDGGQGRRRKSRLYE